MGHDKYNPKRHNELECNSRVPHNPSICRDNTFCSKICCLCEKSSPLIFIGQDCSQKKNSQAIPCSGFPLLLRDNSRRQEVY